MIKMDPILKPCLESSLLAAQASSSISGIVTPASDIFYFVDSFESYVFGVAGSRRVESREAWLWTGEREMVGIRYGRMKGNGYK